MDPDACREQGAGGNYLVPVFGASEGGENF